MSTAHTNKSVTLRIKLNWAGFSKIYEFSFICIYSCFFSKYKAGCGGFILSKVGLLGDRKEYYNPQYIGRVIFVFWVFCI